MKQKLHIVSGGQTGVDRGALDAALQHDLPAGGWCPQGRQAEDGHIPDRYPVSVLPGANYAARTEKNVCDSEGTLILYFSSLSGGTLYTRQCCKKHDKPYLLIDGAHTTAPYAATQLADFIAAHRIDTLNVAGPRASAHPQAYRYIYQMLSTYICHATPTHTDRCQGPSAP